MVHKRHKLYSVILLDCAGAISASNQLHITCVLELPSLEYVRKSPLSLQSPHVLAHRHSDLSSKMCSKDSKVYAYTNSVNFEVAMRL